MVRLFSCLFGAGVSEKDVSGEAKRMSPYVYPYDFNHQERKEVNIK